jgi:predicted  nucleic acid-binding Zn-ribbon protein
MGAVCCFSNASLPLACTCRRGIAQRVQDCKDKIAKKEQDLKELEEEMNDPSNNQEVSQARVQALLRESNEQMALKRSLEDEYRQASAPYKQAQAQLNQLRRELQASKKDATVAQRRLEEYRDKMMAHEDSAESSRSKMSDRLKAWEEEREKCKDRVDSLKQAVSEALRAHEEAEPKVAEARDAADRASRQLGGARRRLQELADRGNEFAVFGSKVKAVYDLVRPSLFGLRRGGWAGAAADSHRAYSLFSKVEKAKQARKFRGKVIGPIGKFVKVAAGKENFAALAEHAMGQGMLDRFIVTCDDDRLLLNDIRRKAGCGKECGVFQQAPTRRYSVPAPAVEGTETVASVLSVSDELVFNCLGT